MTEPTAVLEAVPSLTSRRIRLAMAALCAAVFVAALDQTMVLTVMPSIMASLNIPYTRINDAGWIVTGYLLGYTVAMPLFGRLADVRGRRLMCVIALGLFALGSGLCWVAPNLPLFVASRVVQAAGGGALVPIAMAASADMFPPKRRALILGVIGGAAEAGGVLGPIWGAGLTRLWEWQLIFIVNIPLSLFLIFVCWRLLLPDSRTLAVGVHEGAPERSQAADATRGLPAGDASGHAGLDDRPSDGPRGAGSGRAPKRAGWLQRGQVDYVGAVLMAAALAGLTIGLGGSTQSSAQPVRWPWLAVSVVAFVVFVFYERRLQQPLIRLEFFHDRPFAAATFANLAVGAALIIGMVEVPLYAYSLLGLSELQGGLLLIRLTLLIPVGAVLGGWLADLIGYRITAVMGFLVAFAGYLLLSYWGTHPSGLTMTRDLMITGFGFGLVIAPIGATVIASVGPRWMATGSALVTVTRMIGMMAGISALGSWGLRHFNSLMGGTNLPLRTPGMTDAQYNALVQAYQDRLTASFHTLYHDFFLIAAVIVAIAIIPSILFYGKRARETGRLPFLPQ